MSIINHIEQVSCRGCGKMFTVTPKTEIVGLFETYVTVKCPNCEHIEKVERSDKNVSR